MGDGWKIVVGIVVAVLIGIGYGMLDRSHQPPDEEKDEPDSISEDELE